MYGVQRDLFMQHLQPDLEEYENNCAENVLFSSTYGDLRLFVFILFTCCIPWFMQYFSLDIIYNL